MYVDIGEDYFDKQKWQSIGRHSLRHLEEREINCMSQNWYWQSALAREAMSLVENRIASPADVDTI